MLFANRGSQMHVSIWWAPSNYHWLENPTGYPASGEVYLQYDFGIPLTITARRCAYSVWNSNGTVELAGSTDGSSWSTVHAFDMRVGTSHWRNASQSYTPYTATVSTPAAYRYYKLITQKTGANFEMAMHSLILTGYD